ncbi:HK97 family phage prohead protease [Tautonia marina]|uniref:HK97 family phage prohead protease n=1 Tax=Tautonia marina TaxID=2653855 RepID=UPI00126047EB|nr:HK97 family phage prohead protease [Tautonia marina]
MDKEVSYFAFTEFKADDETRTIEGWASIYDYVDSQKDIVVRGAFAKSLKSGKPAMLWQHRQDSPIGVWDVAEETDKGLLVRGRILDTTLGNDAYKLAKAGAIKGLSIGYTAKRQEFDRDKGTRKLLEVDLWEVSLVTFPANDRAKLTRVKSDDGAFMTERDFEEFLRDAGGLSHKEAKIVVSEGYKALLKHRDGGAEEQTVLRELRDVLTNFRI